MRVKAVGRQSVLLAEAGPERVPQPLERALAAIRRCPLHEFAG